MNDLNINWSGLKKRYIGLDIFRFLAVFGVCANHTMLHLDAYYGPLHPLVQSSGVFLTAFFILSGYSLFVNYASRNVIEIKNLKKFYIRRIIGVIPMYYVAAIIYILFRFAAVRLSGTGTFSIIDELMLAPAEMLGIQSNYHSLSDYTHNGGTWFVSCILMCYLVYPLVQEVSKQISDKARILLMAAFAAVLLYSPFITNRFHTASIFGEPFFRILEFSIGVLLAALKPSLDEIAFVRKYIYKWATVISVSLLMIAAVTVAVRLDLAVGDYMMYSWICLPCFVLIFAGLSGVDSERLSKSKTISYCSSITYVFYLSQLISNKVAKLIIDRFSIRSNILVIAVGWAVCIAIAAVLHELFEKPIKKALRKRFG